MPIAINEVFGPTIQGEGKSLGLPVIFMRLAACNLYCSWCDTPYTWNWKGTHFSHPDKYDKKAEVHKVNADDLTAELLKFGQLRSISALVITGGEPLLQQVKLYGVLHALKQHNWWIEVETNGTIMPTPTFALYVDQFNCSLKLANSGIPQHKRLLPGVIRQIGKGDKFNFKFVIHDYADAAEIEELVNKYDLKQVWIMPEGTNEATFTRTEPIAAYIAKKHGWNFTRREHILKFGNKRGV